MAKFKKGDKVVSTSGNRGVVDEVYDHEQYAVQFDGRSMPDRVEGFKLRAANAASDLDHVYLVPIAEDCVRALKRYHGKDAKIIEKTPRRILIDVDLDGEKPGWIEKYATGILPASASRQGVKAAAKTMGSIGRISIMNASVSSNSVVANALAWKQGGEVAKNADDGAKVRVVAETETLFGKKREEKTMTVGELRAAMTRLGHGRLFADVVRDAEAGKDANPLLKLPCEAWITLA